VVGIADAQVVITMISQNNINEKQGEFNQTVVGMTKELSSQIARMMERLSELSSRIADVENALDDLDTSKKLYKAVEEIQEDLAMEHKMTFVHRL
jgi:ribosomal 50S subunit-associated protein YjgA (DUF615 family)